MVDVIYERPHIIGSLFFFAILEFLPQCLKHMVVCYKAYPVLGGVQHPIGAKYVEIGWGIDKDGWIQILKNYGKIIL